MHTSHNQMGLDQNSEARRATRAANFESNENFWKSMRTSDQKADMKLFKNTRRSALKIIDPYLSKGFVPQLTYEMVDSSGPKCALGDTRAGNQVTSTSTSSRRKMGKHTKVKKLGGYCGLRSMKTCTRDTELRKKP